MINILREMNPNEFYPENLNIFKKKLWNPSKNIGKTYRKYMDSMNSV